MDELTDLVEIVNKNRIKRINLIGDADYKGSKLEILYDKIALGYDGNNDELAKELFGNSSSRKKYLSNLKGQLKERLINTLFFINTKESKLRDSQKAYYSCYKDLNAIHILLGKFARRPAIKMATKTFGVALKYEFTDIALELARILRRHYGSIIGDRIKFNFYNDHVKTLNRKYEAELLAEEFYCEIATNFVNSKGFKKEMSERAAQFSNELDRIPEQYRSFKFSLFYFNIKANQYELTGNYNQTLKVSKEALAYFSKNEHLTSPNHKLVYLVKKLTGEIFLKKFDQAEVTSEASLNLAQSGSRNWYFCVDYTMRLHFYANNFKKAYDTFQKAVGHPKYNSLPPALSELWKIHEGFISYLVSIGKIEVDDSDSSKRFKINKFVNEVPLYSRDKRGVNVNIIILQILFLLKEHKYGRIIDRVESLRMYTHRYLKKNETYRSNCFLKMLMQLPATSFHKTAVIRKASGYLEKLKEEPIGLSQQSAEIEIIPYEKLWDFILESLEDKFHTQRKSDNP